MQSEVERKKPFRNHNSSHRRCMWVYKEVSGIYTDWNLILEVRKLIFPCLFLKSKQCFSARAERYQLLLWARYTAAAGSNRGSTDPTSQGYPFPSTSSCTACLQSCGTRDTLKPSAPPNNPTQGRRFHCKKWREVGGAQHTQVPVVGTKKVSGQTNHFWYTFTTPTSPYPPYMHTLPAALKSLLHFQLLCCWSTVVSPFMLF